MASASTSAGVTFTVVDGLQVEKVDCHPYGIPGHNAFGGVRVTFDQEQKDPLVGSKPHNQRYQHKNGFVSAAIIAYNAHHHLIIRPDDVWIAIMCQFAAYVQKNSDKLRLRLVCHKDKEELTVTGGGSLLTADYSTLCKSLAKQISSHLADDTVAQFAMPDFSTTTDTDRVVGSIILMSALQDYFGYKMRLRCGLPKVTLQGTVQDWKNIASRAGRLPTFDAGDGLMVKWSKMLAPVLQQLVSTAQGKPDKKWWNRIANTSGGGSGPTFISGWITVFAVFDDTGKWKGDTKTAHHWQGDVTSEFPIMDIQDTPAGVVSVPVVVDDNGTVYHTTFVAGHAAVVSPDGTSVAPSVEWSMGIDPKKKTQQKGKDDSKQ